MRAAVVGGGAWGLPAAAELASRGHTVALFDRHGPGGPLASSSGPTRLWRLSHPDRVRVRLGLRAVEAWRRLESLSGRELLLTRGLLWRDASTTAVAAALHAEGIDHEVLDAADVGRRLPGLRPDGRSAVWQGDAGPVLAQEALAAQLARLSAAGGSVVVDEVRSVLSAADGVRLETAGGGRHTVDVAVVAPGPWAPALLPHLGVSLRLAPVLEQVTYLTGRPGWLDLPCLFDGERDGEAGLYAMPTPGLGYKIGIDRPLRSFDPGDADRTPDSALATETARRAVADLGWPTADVTGAQVCTWTDSPDGRFVLDRVLDASVVLACGDSGEGFKFSALMGEVLADLAEGATPDADVASFGLSRFATDAEQAVHPGLGR